MQFTSLLYFCNGIKIGVHELVRLGAHSPAPRATDSGSRRQHGPRARFKEGARARARYRTAIGDDCRRCGPSQGAGADALDAELSCEPSTTGAASEWSSEAEHAAMARRRTTETTATVNTNHVDATEA